MPTIRKPATRIQQGTRTLFLTSFKVSDFLSPDFYKVERLDVRGEKGSQRLLKKARVRSFARDMAEADEHNEAFLPTSVFLATSGRISYDESSREIYFQSEPHADVCPFDVVDGQHRIEGLKIAAEGDGRLKDFPLAVVIAQDMDATDKMLQFVTVNTKQEPVDKGVAQAITARFTAMLDVEPMPYLPRWLRKDVEKGTDHQALEIAKSLNSHPKSPWNGHIQFADEEKAPNHTVTQRTFVVATKRIILNKYHPFNTLPPDKRIAILVNYWRAIDRIFVEHEGVEGGRLSSVVYKFNGIEFFLSLLHTILNVLARTGTYTEEAFYDTFVEAEDYLDGESAAIMSPDYWETGGGASSHNRSGIQNLVAQVTEAIQQSAGSQLEV